MARRFPPTPSGALGLRGKGMITGLAKSRLITQAAILKIQSKQTPAKRAKTAAAHAVIAARRARAKAK